ncbi:MAG TPA: hypothetical protein VFW94_23350 [Candidatus Acidoferrales bacterium]|nr:hypothetical protein [Candidatus Acidoferrales bacterium]
MNVQLSNKPCFFYNPGTGAVWQGLGEWHDPPPGWQKIVCNSAREAEIWSDRMRKWDQLMHEISQDEREMVEGPIREEMRSDLRHRMANARNNVNREFLRKALENLDRGSTKWRYKRESHMAIEARSEADCRK